MLNFSIVEGIIEISSRYYRNIFEICKFNHRVKVLNSYV